MTTQRQPAPFVNPRSQEYRTPGEITVQYWKLGEESLTEEDWAIIWTDVELKIRLEEAAYRAGRNKNDQWHMPTKEQKDAFELLERGGWF